jgi:hypothetical protein
MSSLVLFFFKEGSRNSYNAQIDQPFFKRTIQKALKIKLVHGDTIEDFFRIINPSDLHKIKTHLIAKLIESKMFYGFGFNGKYIVAVDGVHTGSYSDNTMGDCLKKESKNGVATYSKSVLEAKLVAANGFSISLASVWIENNPNDTFSKQDCEQKAFKRLAVQLKRDFPRLPIIIVADALYANKNVIEICNSNNWDWMIVQKENSFEYARQETVLRPDVKIISAKNKTYKFLNTLDDLVVPDFNWFSFEDTNALYKGAWYTNIKISITNMDELQKVGRMRWKIENQGFNEQKNAGYALEHKYSRVSSNATKNYYQSLQIAHLIEQLVMLEERIKSLKEGISNKKIMEWCRNILIFYPFKGHQIDMLTSNGTKFSYLE